MSIEYYVEGKITTQTEGNQRTFSKGSIEHNSLINVNQEGTDTGVSLNSPDQIHTDDKPVSTIDVHLNLFFDGTQNNKVNTDAGPTSSASNKKDSYANDHSNVARGYDAINTSIGIQTAVYIEGVGTVDGKRDTMRYNDYPNNLGSPAAMGDRGIEAKVTKGCIEGAEALGKKFKGQEIDNLKVNVYGFSRGAAAARHFVHVANSFTLAIAVAGNKYSVNPPRRYERTQNEQDAGINDKQNIDITDPSDPLFIKHGYFGACLIKNKIVAKNVIFNFVGLYDTVASFGINHKGFGILIDSDAEQLNLNAINKARFTLQIASDDEYRDNFSLTDIRSTGVNGLEFTLPGVHSDIGGSYYDGYIENSYIFNGSEEDCIKMKDILIDEGWFLTGQLHIFKIEKSFVNVKYDTTWELRGTRKLSNQYDKVSLTSMFHYSKQFNVEYLGTTIERKHTITDPNIIEISSYLISYMNKCHEIRERNVDGDKYWSEIKKISYYSEMKENLDLLKLLRNKYFHWSVNLGPDGSGFGPSILTPATADKRKRYIIPG